MYKMHFNQPQARKQNINKLMNDLAQDFFSELRPTSINPRYNVIESKDDFKLQIALPGIAKKDVLLNVEKGILNINVEQENPEESKYLRREFNYRNFDKNFKLSKAVDSTGIGAKMEKGILTVTLPKKEEAKEKPARKITIK